MSKKVNNTEKKKLGISRRDMLSASAAAAVTSLTGNAQANSHSAEILGGANPLGVLGNNDTTLGQLYQLRALNERIRADLSNDKVMREAFLADPKEYLVKYGFELPKEAFPSPSDLKVLLEDHGVIGLTVVDPDTPVEPDRPFPPRPPGSTAIAVCAVVV